jgi:hypothetical protein
MTDLSRTPLSMHQSTSGLNALISNSVEAAEVDTTDSY